jgi:UPF0716 protein FxsA
MQFTILFLILVPIVEIYIMIKVASVFGAFNTISLTLLSAIVGIYFVKQQGIQTLYSALQTIRNNEKPVAEIITGFCLIIAGVLLIIPGFITDFIGILLLIPYTREKIIKFFIKIEKKKNNTIDLREDEFNDIRK